MATSPAAAEAPRRAPVAPVAFGELPRLFADGRERDVDLDDLPDRVREIALVPRSSPDPTLPAATLVAHALPDGRFALDDDVTRAHLARRCEEDVREGASDLGESYRDLLAVACARRAGASAEATVAALRARQRDAPRLRLVSSWGDACAAFQDLALNAVIAR